MQNQLIRKLLTFGFILVFMSATTSQAFGSTSSSDTGQASSEVRVLESTGQSLLIELAVPAFQQVLAASNLGPCYQVSIPGWSAGGKPGEPSIPFKGVMVGIPPESEPKLTVVETDTEQVTGQFPVCPVAAPEKTQDLAEQLVADPAVYHSTASYPGNYADLGDASSIRSQTVIQLRLQPFQYTPAAQTFTAIKRLVVRIDFGETIKRSALVDEGAFEPVLQGLLINYQESKYWRLPPSKQPAAVQFIQTGGTSYKLAVAQDGMEKVTYADLKAAGVPVDSLDPRTFRLTDQGSEVAILVKGEEDGVFQDGDTLIFYGQKANTRFTDTHIYWLTWGGSNGLRMASSDGTPADGLIPASYRAVVRREVNSAYLPTISSKLDQDHWFWEYISASKPTSKSYTVNLSHVSTASGLAHVRGDIIGYAADPQHHTHLYINNHLIADTSWPAQGEYSFNIEVLQSYLLEGANTIKVELPMTDGVTPVKQDTIFINWFEVDYLKTNVADAGQTAFSGDDAGNWKFQLTGLPTNDKWIMDITNPASPVLITNPVFVQAGSTYTLSFQQAITEKHMYLAASPVDMVSPASMVATRAADLKAATNGADYLIIAHPDFINAVQPLADFHASQGMRVKVVNVQDIYDGFSGGQFDPQAIKDFIAYAYSNWAKPAPAYVLLVGDGNYDFKNYLGLNAPNYIPPFLVETDPWLGEIAADNRYVDVAGNDGLPDMAIGRLPVKTAAEVTNVVDKIIAYKGHSFEKWSAQVAFVASKNDPSAGDFPTSSDALINAVLAPKNVPVDKNYYQITYADSASSRQAILNAFNDGRGIIHFTGHSTPIGWYGDSSDPDNSDLFGVDSIPSLTNTNRLPFLMSMTCLVGNFNNPYIRSLDETLLVTPGTGSIASWSPVGKGISAGHDLLDQGFFKAVYNDNVTDIGRATTLGKLYLSANSTGYQDLLDSYVLLGDPALQLFESRMVFMPVVTR